MPHPLFRLGNRLALCASMVREGTKLADIGTDHAYLPIWLARKGRISSAIAADVKPLPLRSAEQNIRRYHVEEQITTRLSDGLRALSPDEAGDIVLAGMGGELIIRLIGEAPWLKAGDKRLILQPMTSAEELRRFLEREGFAILREQAAEEDGHVYSVMLVEYCPAQAGGGELYPYIGKLDGFTPESRAYIAKCARRLSKKAQGMRLSGNVEEASSLQMILEKLQQLCETNNEKGGLVMATVGQFYDFIDAFAPFHTAMGFDNPGLLVGARDTEVRSVLFALDITPQVVREAAEMGAQLIVSHHPVIFHPLKSLSPDSAPYLLAQYGIAAICAHTNLDMAQGGVNTCLAERLQLKNVRMLKEYEHSGLPEGLVGETGHPYTPEEFAAFVKDVLGCDGLKYVNGGKTITTVGLCGGAGADLTPDAAEQGAQAMVTADTKHNQLLDAEDMGITLVDAGHFFTEDVVIVPLMERLQNRFPEVKMAKSVRAHSPARFL